MKIKAAVLEKMARRRFHDFEVLLAGTIENALDALVLKRCHQHIGALGHVSPALVSSRFITAEFAASEHAMRIDAIPIGYNPPEDVNVIIEVPIGGEPIKYEMDKAAGTLVVDRFLHTPMRYPGNYGFVPHTLSEDGDPIDVLIANTRPIIPGAVINVRPIGVLKMEDESGSDEKIIAVPMPRLTKRYAAIMSYTDLPEITLQQIQHFFEHYKDLEPGKWVKLIAWSGADEARRLIGKAIDCARAPAKG
jgi:inorganic pyrophosphatase